MNRGYGLRLRWGNVEKTVIRIQPFAEWHWRDLYQVMKDLDGMVDAVPYSVDVILDLRSMTVLPSRFLMHMHELHTILPRDVKKLTVLTQKSVFQAKTNHFTTCLKGCIVFANAPEEPASACVS